MDPINFKRTLSGSVESTVAELTESLKAEGFGVLTRIDFHDKIKEKLGKELPATVILGACSPTMAYEAYLANPDVASLLPCNAVVRDVGEGRVSVELAKPSTLLNILADERLTRLAGEADRGLSRALERLGTLRAVVH